MHTHYGIGYRFAAEPAPEGGAAEQPADAVEAEADAPAAAEREPHAAAS